MSKLFKYEFRKTLAAKLIVGGMAVVLEAAYLISLLFDTGNGQEAVAISAGLLALLAFGGVMAMGLTSLVTLHRDMNTRQGYMLFMTPNSSYKILGAKLLEASLSILLAGAFFFALGALDIVLLFSHEQELEQLWTMISELLKAFDSSIAINLPNLICVALLFLSYWIATLVAACLADVLMASVLNGKKGSGLLAFVVFIAIARVVRLLQATLAHALPAATAITTSMLAQSALSLALACGMYVLTAEVMQRKLSV